MSTENNYFFLIRLVILQLAATSERTNCILSYSLRHKICHKISRPFVSLKVKF